MNLRNILRNSIRVVAPSLYESIRIHRYCAASFGGFQTEFRELVFGELDVAILSGPFKGLKYIDKTVWGPIVPKWVGCYEAELHPVISKIVETDYSVVIDVGAAEGYYAVGLACAMPRTIVRAFDTDCIARLRLRELARLNSVTNLSIGRRCTNKKLDRLISEKCLLVCDIEGGELDLLDLSKSHALEGVDILVEVHSTVSRSLSDVLDILRDRFDKSHHISEFSITSRENLSLGETIGIQDSRIEREAVKEHRSGEQAWLWMERF